VPSESEYVLAGANLRSYCGRKIQLLVYRLHLSLRPADVGIDIPEKFWMGRRREHPRYVVGIEPIPQTAYVDEASQTGVPRACTRAY